MGWDDDDEDDEWDAEDIEAKLEAQLKEKEKAKRRAEGLDSDSEEEKTKAEVATAASSTSPKPKPKPKPKFDKKKGKQAEEPADEAVPTTTSQEEKLRRQKLVEEADARLATDLFAGCEKPADVLREEEEKVRRREEEVRKAATKPKIVVVDAFDKVELNVQADVEQLCSTCINKLNKGQAKGGALKFLVDLLKQLEGNLELKELAELEKLIDGVVKEKNVQKGAQQSKANKANTKLSKTTKFNTSSEWEEVYGGGEGDEDWTQEEWDEWYKTQGK